MKQNIKRFILWLCTAACLFSLAACSASADAGEAEELDGQMVSNLCQISEDLLTEISSFSKEEAEKVEADLLKDKEMALANGVASWINIMGDTGALAEIISSDVSGGEDGELICTVYAQYEKRKLEYKVYYTMGDQGIRPQSMSFAPEYTVGENMVKAFMNMVLGMGTVFAVLIFLCLLIACFKFINTAEQRMKDKKLAASAAHVPAPAVPVIEIPEEEELVDDLELVAVITAAVAAASSSSPDGLVVRSIKRAPSPKWKRA